MNAEKPMAHPFEPVLEVLKGSHPDKVCKDYGISKEELNKRTIEYQEMCRRIALSETLPTEEISRNAPCPCGSGKKYKKCCLPIHEEIIKNMPKDQLLGREKKAKERKRLEQQVQKGFDMLLSEDFAKAKAFSEKLIESYPEDDRLHDIFITSCLALGDYDKAFYRARERWQIAEEEKNFFQENGYHKREKEGGIVHFYSPSTWLEKFWIANRARHYREKFPQKGSPKIIGLVKELKSANDLNKFPQRDQEGYLVRRKALEETITVLKEEGFNAIPHLLPLTYYFSWATLFVPEIIAHQENREALTLLAELSMFRYPFFAQECLKALERAGEKAVPGIKETIENHKAFDELKVGIIMVLGNIPTEESFSILTALTEHESPYIVNWVAQALAKHKNPEALVYLEKAKERLGELSKIAGAIKELAGLK